MVMLFSGVAAAAPPAPRSTVAQPSPAPAPTSTIVDADTITYDSQQQVITAQGNVRVTLGRYRLFADRAQYNLRTSVVTAAGRIRLVDTLGQELRGDELTYNTRTEEGFLVPAQGRLQQRVILKGDRLDVSPTRYLAQNSTVTTCDPDHPIYQVTARQIEVRPGQAVIARDAALYVGGRRLVTLREFRASLREGEDGTQFPTFGGDRIDAFWLGYRLPVKVADATGRLAIKVGVSSGPMPLLTLSRGMGSFTATLRVGRTQTSDTRAEFDLLRYDVGELAVTLAPQRIGSTPLEWKASALAGWYSEQLSGIQTTKLDGTLSVGTGAPITPRLSYAVAAGVNVSGYGTGASRTIATYGASLTYTLDPFTSLTVGYAHASIQGATPLSIDVIDPADTVSIGVTRAVPFRYRFSAAVAQNTALSETIYQAALFVVAGPRLELGAEAQYNTRLAAFDALDLTVRVICDCVDAVFRYRASRGEVSFEIGLMDLPPRGAPFVPRPAPAAPSGLPER
jgi:LPS-assembly protein